jgi:acyl carrier protein
MTEADVRNALAAALNSEKPRTWEIDYRFLGDAVDSLDHASFILALQEQFGIVVPDEDVGRLDTIANVLAYAHDRA